MPLVKFTKEEIRAGSLECSVCKEDFQEEDEEIKQMPCKHFFHNDCLKPWLFEVSILFRFLCFLCFNYYIFIPFLNTFIFFKKKHNSGPVYRYALPFELKKTEQTE